MVGQKSTKEIDGGSISGLIMIEAICEKGRRG